MKKWIKKYWYIPLFAIMSIILWVLIRRKGTPFAQTIAEVKAIQAESEATKLKEILGTTKAKQLIEEKYQEEIRDLDEKQKTQAKELENDPSKLAKFLVRASGGGASK